LAVDQFDIAPFRLPNTPDNVLLFEEPRDIVAVELGLATDGVAGSDSSSPGMK
jgi:hypothetical protein